MRQKGNKMPKHCYICNKQDGGVERTKVNNIFDSKTPISDKKVCLVLQEISGKVVEEKHKKRNNLCAKCYKNLLEYDYLLARLNDMRKGISNNIAKSEDIRKTQTEDDSEINNRSKKKVKFVVPASKLKPVPPGFDLKLKNNNLFSTKTHPISVTKQPVPIFQTQQKIPQTISQTIEPNNQCTEMPIILPSDISSILDRKGFSLDDLVLMKDKNNENNDDRPMEIDEDAVIVEAENGLLSVVSHQKLLYGNSGLSFVMPQDTINNQDEDGQDSNSESHIELQVSGDEETAKAIIAAANEQGGTFIKVDTGEMFEVQSVESKMQDFNNGDDALRLDDGNMVEVVDDQFKCLFCERNNTTVKSESVLGDADWMMNHLKTAHSARLYLCSCGVIIRKRADFTAHLEIHADKNNILTPQTAERLGRQHECQVCKKKFSSRLVLSGHMNTHTGNRPYTCDICNKSFASRYSQQAHMKTHSERPRPYKCTECGKSFFTPHNLAHHQKIHSGVKDFVCKVCGKAFGSQHNLEVHAVVHSGVKPFVCSVCNKGFARRAEVRDHMRIHTGERPFECEHCGARFSQRSNLHSHRRATHLNDKRHQCPHCTKKFKRRRLLEYHIKSNHTGERPLKCELCDASFIYPEHYKKHVRIHSGERPFACEVCGKSFNSRDNRNVHRFVHSDRKPYECVICGTGYMRKHLLYQHMNSTGHISESIVVNQPRVSEVEDEVFETDELQVLAATEKGPTETVNAPTQYILSAGHKAMNIIQENEAQIEDNTYMIQNFENSEQIDGTVLENLTTEQLEESPVLSDGNSTWRFFQVQLSDGESGWVAVGQ
ncbi:unnamed protein product [Leptosia nina]|uniref:C2H2-type domain-containing protein n=1 Tax=Leptosia nina TaxID=320188 RepID=A0AAV1JIH5_9NEOP